jgi:hypothetical protein
LRRLSGASDKEYWQIAGWLTKYSTVMLLIALQHVKPRWHREMALSDVKRTLQKVRGIALHDLQDMEYYRVWIPKTKPGEYRPLGCPTLEWRIYLHMLNQLIVYKAMLNGQIPDEQHGFVPGRGTLTAWKHILSRVIHERNIYEIDLSKFFDGVNLDMIHSELQRITGMPQTWVSRIENLNWSCVQPYNTAPPGEESFAEDPEFLKRMKTMKKNPPIGVPQGSPMSPFAACLALKPLLDQTNRKFISPVTGYGETSLVGYADDWGIYGSRLDPSYLYAKPTYEDYLRRSAVCDFSKFGIRISPAKSGWVKRDGIWLKPLKFLGLVYDGQLDKLQASTRKGATLTFDKHSLVDALEAQSKAHSRGEYYAIPTFEKEIQLTHPQKLAHKTYVDSKLESENTYYHVLTMWPSYTETRLDRSEKHRTSGNWTKFVNSSLIGLAQSRLYADAWATRKFLQSFELSYTQNSWMGVRGRKSPVRLDVFNSTSYAYSELAEALCKGLKPTIRKVLLDQGPSRHPGGDTSNWL